MERAHARLRFGVIGIVLTTLAISGCGKGASNETDPTQQLPAINSGDLFTIVRDNGETTQYPETQYSTDDPIPLSYSRARVDYIPGYYWEENYSSSTKDYSSKLIALPTPTMQVEFATDLNYYSGNYGKYFQFTIPGVTPGPYFADEHFQFEMPEPDDEERSGNVYLDKVTLTQVGNVGEPVRGTYEYWTCSFTCKHLQGEFVATREEDIKFEPQGTLSAPYVIEGAPIVRRENLVAKIDAPSFYKIQVKTGGVYEFHLGSDIEIAHAILYSDADYSNEICALQTCQTFTAPGEYVYLKVEAVIDEAFKNDAQNDSVQGDRLSITLIQTDFGNTADSAFDLGTAPAIRKTVYASGERSSYYKIGLQPDKYYTVGIYNSPRYYGGFYVDISSSAALGDWVDCNERLSQNETCTFLSGPDQHDLLLQITGYQSSEALFTLLETAFKSVGTASAPVLIEEFNDYEQDVPRFRSEVGTDSSYYKIAVTPLQLYHVDLTGAFDNVDITVFSDAGFTNSLGSSSARSPAPDETSDTDAHIEFTTLAEQSFLYVKVDGTTATKHSGSRFGLAVYPLYKAHGSTANPVVINSALGTEFVTEIGGNEDSYYTVTLPPNTAVDISLRDLSGDDYISGYAYANADFNTDMQCHPRTGYSCTLYTDSDGITLYIRINSANNATGASIGITAAQHHFNVRGTIDQPYLAGSAPLSSFHGETDSSASYLKVRVGGGKTHRAELNSHDDDLNLSVYANSAFSDLLCESKLGRTTAGVLETDSCNFSSPTGGYVYIKISGENATTYQGSRYDVRLEQVFQTEGTHAAPANLGTLPIQHAIHTVGPSNASIYTTAVATGVPYEISVTNTNEQVSFNVYDGDQYDTKSHMCSGYASKDGGSGVCVTENTTSTTLWIEVVESTQTYGAKFAISITQAGGNEGTEVAPVDLGSVFPVNRASTVGRNGASYYTLNVSPNATYQIDLWNGESAHIELYGDSGFTTRRSCTVPAGTSASATYCKLQTAADDSLLYIKVASYSGSVFTLNAYTALATVQGSQAEPIVIATKPPFSNQPLQTGGAYRTSYYKIPVDGGTSYTMNFYNANEQFDISVIGATSPSAYSNSCNNYNYSGNRTCAFVTEPNETAIILELRAGYYDIGSYFTMDMVQN